MSVAFIPITGIGEVVAGTDIAQLIVDSGAILDGDVLVVTSKIVSKADGLTTTQDKDDLLDGQTDRDVARVGRTRIVRTRHGLTMAAGGIDASNTEPGTLLPLPVDPDESARTIRRRLRVLADFRVAVIVSDTAGRAWRVGQTDIAIGCAGIMPFESFEGRTDPYGNELLVTVPALADEIAGGAELASGKFGGVPIVIARGLNPAWLTDGDGPGAVALVRPEAEDLFGLGAREAVVAALTQHAPIRGFSNPGAVVVHDIVDLAMSSGSLDGSVTVSDTGRVIIKPATGPDGLIEAGALRQRLIALGVAHGLDVPVEIVRSATP